MKYLVTLNGNEYEVEVGADSVTLTAERIGAAKAAPAPAPVSRPAPTAAPHPLPPLVPGTRTGCCIRTRPHRFPAAGQPLRLRCQAISSR